MNNWSSTPGIAGTANHARLGKNHELADVGRYPKTETPPMEPLLITLGAMFGILLGILTAEILLHHWRNRP